MVRKVIYSVLFASFAGCSAESRSSNVPNANIVRGTVVDQICRFSGEAEEALAGKENFFFVNASYPSASSDDSASVAQFNYEGSPEINFHALLPLSYSKYYRLLALRLSETSGYKPVVDDVQNQIIYVAGPPTAEDDAIVLERALRSWVQALEEGSQEIGYPDAECNPYENMPYISFVTKVYPSLLTGSDSIEAACKDVVATAVNELKGKLGHEPQLQDVQGYLEVIAVGNKKELLDLRYVRKNCPAPRLATFDQRD